MVTEVGGDFNMYGNERLSDISALESLKQLGGNFFVIDNRNLFTEDIKKLADQVNPNKVTISDNKN